MRARRRFAQHFLEAAWVRKLVDALALDPADAVVEVGPGRGALTLALAAAVRRVAAIEIDRDLAAALRTTAPPNVTVVEGDVLRVDLAPLASQLLAEGGPGTRVRIVGNLPYNISSPILFRILDLARQGAPVFDATVMLQREVADRVTAQPGGGDWGPLGIGVQLRAEVSRVLALPPGAFRPPPQVHSAVVRMRFRAPEVAISDEALFDSLVRALFTQRRKTLGNALKAFASGRGVEAGAVLLGVGLDPRRRPETLTLDELARLAAHLTAARSLDETAML